MADLPVDLPPDLATRLADAFDQEGKICRALEGLGPVGDRDVILVDGAGGRHEAQLAELGARLTHVPANGRFEAASLPADSADAIVALWTAFRGVDPVEIAEADRVLRAGGRLLIVHDYGRDDVSGLRGDLPEYGSWTRRDGPFLRGGFRIRVVHCWWTWPTIEEAQEFLGAAFGERGQAVGETLKRPRLSYNVAIYHRSSRYVSPPATVASGQTA